MKNIEVEVKGVISPKNYQELADFIKENYKEAEIKILNKEGIGKDNLPQEEGIYLIHSEDLGHGLIDVYEHDIKGLSCFSEDFGSAGTGVDDSIDCHVSVQNTGLEFLTKVGELK